MPNFSSESKTPISSNRKSVYLHEWWLIEVERDSRLGVGGFTNRETQGSRRMRLLGSASVGKRCNLNTFEAKIQVFHSAAIAKRLDDNTVEAADGITITICGCINRSRTLSYGFLPEVCDRFLSGFPCNWEQYGAKHDKRADTAERSLPISFDDLPVTRVRDLLMSTIGESEAYAFTNIIFRDILKLCGGESCNQTASVDSGEKGTWNSTEIELDHKQDGVSLSNPTQKILEDARKDNSKETENDDKQGNGGFTPDATQNMTEKAHIQVQADAPISGRPAANSSGTSPESPVELFDPFLKVTDPKPSSQRRHAEEGNTSTKSGNKRRTMISQQRYPLRSKRIKKNTGKSRLRGMNMIQ